MIGRIEHTHAIGDDRVAVKVGSERIAGHTPDALIVSLHGQGLGITFERDRHFRDFHEVAFLGRDRRR